MAINRKVHEASRDKSGDVQVLVATDIARASMSTGVSHVINHDLQTFRNVHRIGRTGRAGHDGIAISFCDESESEYLSDIEKLIETRIERVTDHERHQAAFLRILCRQSGADADLDEVVVRLHSSLPNFEP